jgi:anti-sigma regulatory factor (Ser/Thr protein kinase)
MSTLVSDLRPCDPPPGSALLRVHLPAHPESVARARRLVRALRGGERERDRGVDDLELVVSELVTNALRHGGSREGNPIELTVLDGPHGTRVEVRDRGEGFLAPWSPGPDDPWEPGGRGLQIVDRLARHWGVERSEGTVWVVLPG